MIFGGRFALDARAMLRCARRQPKPDVAAGAMRLFWDVHLGPSITSPLVPHPGLDDARITYRTVFLESLDHGKDQGLDRITDVIMGTRPVYDPRERVHAAAERAALFTHLEAARLKRRTTK